MKDAPEVLVGDEALLQRRLRALVGDVSDEALRGRRRWSMAIPGGSVVPRLLTGLGAGEAAWGSADVFWCDERAVPPTDAESNYGQSAAGWLGALAHTGMRVHAMHADAPSLDDAARRYEAELVATLGAVPVLDIAVVGVGEDGHVASLFPDHAALAVHDRLVLAIEDSPKPPSRRLTLSLGVLARARVVVVAAFGEGKRDAMAAALGDPTSPMPVARLLREAARAMVLLDAAAASPSISGAPSPSA